MNDGSTPSSRSIDEQAHYVASALLARRRPVGTAVSTLRKWKIGDVGDYMRCQREELFRTHPHLGIQQVGEQELGASTWNCGICEKGIASRIALKR